MAKSIKTSTLSPAYRSTFGIKDGTTTAKGLEKAIFVAGDGILKAQFAITDLFYGKFDERKSATPFQKAIDKGIVNLVEDLSSIDLCQILNEAINKIPGSKQFDPNADPPKDPLGSAKYAIQKKAYDLQLKIDGFNLSYIDSSNLESKSKGVFKIINEIKEAFFEISDPESIFGLRDSRILLAYPQLSVLVSFLETSFRNFSNYTDYRQIPVSQVQNIINRIDKIRAFLILAQGLNTPAAALNFIDTTFPNANIQEQIQRLQKIIDPAKLIPLLRNVIQSLKKVQSICNVFKTFIAFGKRITSGSLIILKYLKFKIIPFLKKLPIPNVYTTTGITTAFADVLQKIEISLNALIKRLSQINTLFSLCLALVSQIIIILYDLIKNINIILVGLESCNNIDPQIIKDLQDIRDGLQNTAVYFEKFVNNYENNKKTTNSTFGDYTIQIVSEEVTDDSIKIRRRYGIALGKNGFIAAKSTPTFASDNTIIINEVKIKLVSLGLVKSEFSAANIGDMAIIMESLNYLEGNDITFEDVDSNKYDSGLDSGMNENENDGLGINAFINKLQGGKKLRQRMRKMMKNNVDQLQKDSAASKNPIKVNVSGLTKVGGDDEKEDKINKLEDEKNDLLKKLASTKNQNEKSTINLKIKSIDSQIQKLKNG